MKAVEMPQQKLSQRVAVAAAAVLLTPALASCGFAYATDQHQNPGVGVNDRDGDVDVLNALIVSENDGSGTFIATFSNNDITDTTQFLGIGGGVSAEAGEPIEVPKGDTGVANLHREPGGIAVTGDGIVAGRMVEVVLSFSDQETRMLIPVVSNTGIHEGVDGPHTPADDHADH